MGVDMSVAYAIPRNVLAVLFAVLVTAGCAQLIAEYSADAYKTATTLKAETLGLVDKSGESYSSHKKDIDDLTVKIDAAYEFAAGFPNNQLVAQEWQLLRNPDGNLYGAFAKRWRQQGRLSETFRGEKKLQLGVAFDQIICLEANKKDSRSCSSLGQSASARQ
jgi:hypothetical protein